MHRGSVWLRAAGIAALAALVGAAGCEAPTEVTLVLTTDVSCATLKMQGTTITVGAADELEDKAPVAGGDYCVSSDSGVGAISTIGTFVVVPSGGRSDAFAVRIVSGVNRAAIECAPGGGQAPDYTGCIVARRELAFVPHTPLTLPIVMRQDCVSIPCGAHQTCDNGVCVSENIPDPARCTTGGGCSEITLLDGGVAPSSDAIANDASGEDDSGFDSSLDLDGPLALDGARADSTTPDAHADAGEADSTIADARPGTDAPGPDGAPIDASSQEAATPSDASVLGSCVTAGTSAGVTCGSVTCSSGEVCCVAQPAAGSATSSCTSSAACNTSATGSTEYSSLACRDVGDCPVGNVCCLLPGQAVGNGYTTACRTSSACPNTFTTVQACRNLCECPSIACDLPPSPCLALAIGTCGGKCP
jgi:hypothetical protein